MQTLNIKTHRTSADYQSHHFFVLSKGYNAGKPMLEPCPNCFVITAESGEDKKKLFWICYCLWKAGNYIPLLVGSVIPFIHIKDVQKEITRAVVKALDNPRKFAKLVEQFQAFHKIEKHMNFQMKLMARLKCDMARNLLS